MVVATPLKEKWNGAEGSSDSKAFNLRLNLFHRPSPVFTGVGYKQRSHTDTAPPQGGRTHSAGRREQFSKLEELGWGGGAEFVQAARL